MKKRIVLFGCGSFARNHVRELSKRDEVEVSCLIDPFDKNRKSLGDVYNETMGVTPRSFRSLKELLASGQEFDAAIIVSPPKTHFEIASAMIRLGKSVYVEKPFTVTVEEAKELFRFSKENNVEVVIGANRCVFPAYRAAAEVLKENKIGNLKAVSIYYRHNWEGNTTNNWRQDPSESASGILADHSPHYNHFLFTDLVFKPAMVRHMGTRFNKAGIDVDVCYCITDPKGRPAYVIFDGSPSDDDRKEVIKIYGNAGVITIKFNGKSSDAYIKKNGRREKIDTEYALREIESLGIRDYNSHPALIHNFVSLLSGEVKQNANPAKEGILPVYLTELIEKSRGERRENSLTKTELKEISIMVDEGGYLEVDSMEKYFDRGEKMIVDKSIFKL